MTQIRPKGMTQGAFAELLRTAGFEACSKTAVSLAERPRDSGVQFTREARKAAQELLKSTEEGTAERTSNACPYRDENRKNGRKTTVWLDDELREWVETQAYLSDISVGEYIRKIIYTEIVRCKARGTDSSTPLRSAQNDNEEKAASRSGQAMLVPTTGMRNAASDVGASEAAGERTGRLMGTRP